MRVAPIAIFIIYLFVSGTLHAQDVTTEATLLFAIADTLFLDEHKVLSYQMDIPYDSTKCLRLTSTSPQHRSYFDMKSLECSPHLYRDLWFSFIGKYEPLGQAIHLLLKQYRDIARRLNVAHQRREELRTKFGKYKDSSFLEPIDQDIRHLSALGMQLKNVTDRFFSAIKPKLIDAEIQLEMLSARKEIMGGLKSFENELAKATSAPSEAIDQSLEEIVEAVDKAVQELERAIAN